jgi:hypothetical protein
MAMKNSQSIDTGNIEWHKKESEDKQRNKQTSKTTNTRKHNTDPTNQF